MLGIRFKPEDEEKLERYARSIGKPTSAMARDWILERFEREEIDRKIANAAALDAEERAKIKGIAGREATDAWLRWLDAEDGGYDWGPDGPPGPA